VVRELPGARKGRRRLGHWPGGATHKNPEEVVLSSDDIDYYPAIALGYPERAGTSTIFRRHEHAHRAGHARLIRGKGALSPTGTIGRLVKDAVRTREG